MFALDGHSQSVQLRPIGKLARLFDWSTWTGCLGSCQARLADCFPLPRTCKFPSQCTPFQDVPMDTLPHCQCLRATKALNHAEGESSPNNLSVLGNGGGLGGRVPPLPRRCVQPSPKPSPPTKPAFLSTSTPPAQTTRTERASPTSSLDLPLVLPAPSAQPLGSPWACGRLGVLQAP